MNRKARSVTGRKRRVDTSIPLMLAPFVIMFAVFIVLPILIAVVLSFTNYNGVQSPKAVGLSNYVALLTQDTEFMRYENTFYALDGYPYVSPSLGPTPFPGFWGRKLSTTRRAPGSGTGTAPCRKSPTFPTVRTISI